MDFWNNLSSNEKAIAVVVGLLIIAGLTEGAASFVLLMLIMFGLYAFRQREEGNRERESREAEAYVEREIVRPQRRSASSETAHEHALEAVRRAGLNPYTVQVLPVDIGVLTFHGSEEPVIHRTYPVEDDADYIQPFVQLRVPVDAVGRIKFELVDHTGQPLFVHEDNYQLERGRNLVIPSTRLPVHDERMTDGRWRMRVSADGVLLADYNFTWANSESADFRRHLGEDGEISSSMRAVLAENRLGQMSLDDLLGEQDEDEDEASTPPRSASRG